VIAAAGNSRLAQLSRASRQYYFNHRIARRYDADETRESIAGHRRILAALAHGDGPAAESRAREHVDYALEIVLKKIA
jgi:DNA-binding GntR family transcriptional regulator